MFFLRKKKKMPGKLLEIYCSDTLQSLQTSISDLLISLWAFPDLNCILECEFKSTSIPIMIQNSIEGPTSSPAYSTLYLRIHSKGKLTIQKPMNSNIVPSMGTILVFPLLFGDADTDTPEVQHFWRLLYLDRLNFYFIKSVHLTRICSLVTRRHQLLPVSEDEESELPREQRTVVTCLIVRWAVYKFNKYIKYILFFKFDYLYK